VCGTARQWSICTVRGTNSGQIAQCEELTDSRQNVQCEVMTDSGQTVEGSSGHTDTQPTVGTV